MKKNLLLLSITLLSFTYSIGQVDEVKKDIDASKEAKDLVVDNQGFNRWTIELVAGQSKGTKPYTEGYYSSNPNTVLGTFEFNSFGLGVRYMFSPKFGLKLDVNSDRFQNNPKTDSKPFDVEQYRLGVQGVVNAARLFNIENQLGRLSFLLHGGFQLARVTPKLETPIDIVGGPSNFNKTEYNLGVMFGVSPEVRVTKRISIIGDLSFLTNFRQHFAWDGHFSVRDNNLSGQLLAGSIGLTYSLGKEKMHGDWAIIADKKLKELEDIDKRVGELETMMNDTDKDGVPDYLDAENNSISGVAVDTKGRMVDINKNGVPDELEKYMSDTYVDKSKITETLQTANADMIKRLINEGYVTTYFDTNKINPTNVSTEGIDFMLTYLRNNPTASIDIIGHADEIGKTESNDKLANNRANTVKTVLTKAGIDPSRMNIISSGEDTSVAVDSSDARRLVRRVTFKVK